VQHNLDLAWCTLQFAIKAIPMLLHSLSGVLRRLSNLNEVILSFLVQEVRL